MRPAPRLLHSDIVRQSCAARPFLHNAHATLAAACINAADRLPVPETIRGRVAALNVRAILSANDRNSSGRLSTDGAYVSNECATAKPRRARSSGAAWYVSVATSSNFVLQVVAMKSGPFSS